MSHPHNKDKDKLVRKILRQIAKEKKEHFTKIKELFVYEEDAEITEKFWKTLKEICPSHNFVDVYHCPGCGKFDLE